jgi:hypothetical protein
MEGSVSSRGRVPKCRALHDRPPDPQATLSKQPTNKLVDDEGMDRDPADSRCSLGRSAPFNGVRSTARSHLTMQTSIADDGGCGRGEYSASERICYTTI